MKERKMETRINIKDHTRDRRGIMVSKYDLNDLLSTNDYTNFGEFFENSHDNKSYFNDAHSIFH
jgi:hypothetical protein